MTGAVVAGVAGVVFALGLVVSGMTTPHKVTSFLDVGGAWDPSLAFVMAGAIAVHAPIVRLVHGRPSPLIAGRFAGPLQRTPDPSLVIGAALFGVGWGLSGYCPGPALVSAGGGAPEVLAFVAAMIAGSALTRRWLRREGVDG